MYQVRAFEQCVLAVYALGNAMTVRLRTFWLVACVFRLALA